MLIPKIKNNLIILGAFIIFASILSLLVPNQAQAAPIPAGCPGSTLQGPPAPGVCEAIPAGCPGSPAFGPPAPGTTCPYEASGAGSGGDSDDGTFAGSSSSKKADEDCHPVGGKLDASNCEIINKITIAIKILSAAVGIVVVIMIAVGGVQYSAARDNPQAVAAAKGRIVNAILALVAYLFMFSLLQYLIPGGVL